MTAEECITHLKAKPKYAHLCGETIDDVYRCSLRDSHDAKKALERSAKRLHQIFAAYLGAPNYVQSRRALADAIGSGDDSKVRDVCRQIMSVHASANERLALTETGYYECIWKVTSRPRIVVDLAAALHPLAFRWMQLERDVEYHASDINQEFVELTNFYFALEGLRQLAEWRDICVRPPRLAADVAFLFKMYHCLERRKRFAGLIAIEQVNAPWVVVSFPARNLAGRKTDILSNYLRDITAAAERNGWTLERVKFDSEDLVFIGKDVAAPARWSK